MSVQLRPTWKELEAQLIAKAWKDEAFAEELQRDAKAVLERETGQQFPDNFEVQVLEEKSNTYYLIIPEKPASLGELGELSEEDLAHSFVMICPCICSVGPRCNTSDSSGC